MEKSNTFEQVLQSPHGQPPPCGDVRAFLTAAATQNMNLVRYFIENDGMPADATEAGKPTALCYAAARRNTEMLNLLLRNGADPDYADDSGHTVMHYAALGGCVETIAQLVAAGASINRENCHGTTPLGLAREAGENESCAELLARHGATLTGGPPRPKCFH